MITRRHLALSAALVVVAVGCGSDDAREETAEEGTGNPYTQAIIESTSHDEILLPAGDMVVAVRCEEGDALPTVTAVANGLPAGTYVGVFAPSTGVDLSLEVAGAASAVTTAQMELPDAEYTVTFADIDGGVFDLRGC